MELVKMENNYLNNLKEKVKSINFFAFGLTLLVVLVVYFSISMLMGKKGDDLKDVSEIDHAIKEWVNKNPDVILKSVENHMKELQRQAAENQKRQEVSAKDYVQKNRSSVEDHSTTPALNKKGKITVVEFFDYHCGHCRTVASYMDKIANEYKNVTFVFRDYPIMSRQSFEMAKVATAVHMTNPSKYIKVHKDFMSERIMDEAGIKEVIVKNGMNYEKLSKYIADNQDKIEGKLKENMELARNLNLRGTPAFVVNGEVIPGAVDYNTMKSILDRHLKK